MGKIVFWANGSREYLQIYIDDIDTDIDVDTDTDTDECMLT